MENGQTPSMLKTAGRKQAQKLSSTYEWMDRIGANISINLTKINTILMFNTSSPHLWNISDKFMIVLKPLMNIMLGDVLQSI